MEKSYKKIEKEVMDRMDQRLINMECRKTKGHGHRILREQQAIQDTIFGVYDILIPMAPRGKLMSFYRGMKADYLVYLEDLDFFC